MKKYLLRLLALLLALTLLPLYALAEGHEDEPLYRSDFTLRFWMDADAFPNDGRFHYSDWEKLLNCLSVHGVMDYQRLMDFKDKYIRLNGNLRMNDQDTFPFLYESYGESRYFTTDALGGDSLYFYMLNFFQFMLKPYYFMGLPTNLLSVVMAPDLSLYTVNQFLEKWQKAMGDAEHLNYFPFLRKLNMLNRKINNKRYMIYYFLITNTLGLIYGNNVVYDDLSKLTTLAKYLDPERKGYTVSQADGTTTYTVGDTTFLTTSEQGWHFCLPDPNGYVFDLELATTSDTLEFTALATLNGETRLNLSVQAKGLALNESLTREGNVVIHVEGGAVAESLPQPEYDIQFHFKHQVSAEALPRNESFELSWIHPESKLPAIGLRYEAQVETAPSGDIVNQRQQHNTMGDFFGMNSDVLESMKQKYLKPMLVSLLPFTKVIPVGVYSDLYAMLKESGFLAMLGVEGI